MTTTHEHAGGLGPLYAAARSLGDRARVRRRRATTATTSGPSPPSMRRSRPAPGSSRSRTSRGRPARSCPSRAIADARPRSRARSSSSTAPRPPARSRSDVDDLGADAVRGAGPEVAARAGGDGRAGRRPGARSSASIAGARRLVRASSASRRAGTRGLVAGRPPVRGDRAATGRRSSGWPARSAGCRCSSGSTASTGAGAALAARRRRRAWPRSRASTRPDPAPRDGHPGHVPDRRLAAPRRPSTSSGRGSSRSPGRSPSLDALRISVGFFNTEDELDRFAEAVELLAAPHARDAAAAARRSRSSARDDRPAARPAGRSRSAGARGPRSAGASSGTRRGPSSGPWPRA